MTEVIEEAVEVAVVGTLLQMNFEEGTKFSKDLKLLTVRVGDEDALYIYPDGGVKKVVRENGADPVVGLEEG